MNLTQTKLNQILERSRMLIQSRPDLPSEIYVYITTFFNKIRTLQKLNEILIPVEIEIEIVNDIQLGIRFSWLKSTEKYPHKIDNLDLIFINQNFFLLRGYYETIDLEINSKIEYDKDFAERALVHLQHFKNLNKKK